MTMLSSLSDGGMRFTTTAILSGMVLVSGLFSLSLKAHSISQLSSASRPIACLDNERVFVQAETRDLWIIICGVERPQFYVSVKKSKQDSLRLPLKEARNQVYTAIKAVNYDLGGGVYIYTLTPDLWKISYYGRTVLSQKILSWQIFD